MAINYVDLHVAELAVRASTVLTVRYAHYFVKKDGVTLFCKQSSDVQQQILNDILQSPINLLNERKFEMLVYKANSSYGKNLDARKVYHSFPFKPISSLIMFYLMKDFNEFEGR